MISIIFCLLQLLATFALQATPLEVSVTAETAILMNQETGAILFEKNSHKKMYPASITKIATALYTLSVYEDKLDTVITSEHDDVAWISKDAKKRSSYTLPSYWLEPDGTHIGIKQGETLPLLDLLYGMLIASGNDASNVIARFIGGTIPRFTEELNQYLKQIGCLNTHFCNPHGLHHPDHMTTAYDMALIAKEAMKYPIFKQIVKSTSHLRPKTNKQEPSILPQSNKLLKKGTLYYSPATGIKTGWTSDAKNTFVGSAEYNGRKLIVVLMQVNDREELFKQARKLFEAAFKEKSVQKVLLHKGKQKYLLNLPDAASPIETYLLKDVCVDYFPSEEPELICKLHWNTLSIPIKKDQQIGSLLIMNKNGYVFQSVPLFAFNNVSKNWKTNFLSYFTFKNFSPIDKKIKNYAIMSALSFLVLTLFFMKGKKKPRNFQ